MFWLTPQFDLYLPSLSSVVGIRARKHDQTKIRPRSTKIKPQVLVWSDM